MTQTKRDGATSGIGFPDDLISPESENSIEFLTKEGHLSEGRTTLWGGIGMAIGAPILGTAGLLWDFDLSSEADLSHTTQVGRTFLGPLADVLVPMVIPLMPLFPYLLFALGGVGVVMAISGRYVMSRAKTAPEIEISCPNCGHEYRFSSVSKGRCKFVCSNCYARIVGSKDGYATRHRCDYCEHEYYGGAKPAGTCMSCGLKAGGKEQECPHCGAVIPKDVRYCRSCLTWTAPPPTFGISLLVDNISYFPAKFSVGACRAYVKALLPRIRDSAEAFHNELGGVEDFEKNTQIYGSGGLYNSIDPFMSLVLDCMQAIQWAYHHGGSVDQEVISGLEDKLPEITGITEKILGSGKLLKSDQEKYRQFISSTQGTISAVMELAETRP